MRNFIQYMFVLLIFAASCKDDENDFAQPLVTASALCDQAGGSLDPVKNECVCPAGFSWSGTQCLSRDGRVASTGSSDRAALRLTEAEATATNTATELGNTPSDVAVDLPVAKASSDPAHADESDSHASSTISSMPKTPKPQPVAINPAVHAPVSQDGEPRRKPKAIDKNASKTQRRCLTAGGEWLAKDGYCLCAKGRVLVGEVCLEMSGQMTRSVCERAAFPGFWRGRQCHCPKVGYVFSPNRGGCVAMRLLSRATERRICESSLNRGRWQETQNTCSCPQGKIWLAEACLLQADLSSEQVCESDFNHGRWNAAGKYCQCPRGKLWFNQACRNLAKISLEEACTADINRGQWREDASECDCLDGYRWDAASKRCLRD